MTVRADSGALPSPDPSCGCGSGKPRHQICLTGGGGIGMYYLCDDCIARKLEDKRAERKAAGKDW